MEHYFVIFFSIFSFVTSDFLTIDQGTLIGTTGTARHGTVFKVYYKIPYAKPPIGKLRFKPPTEVDPWPGILNASIPTTQADGCIQARSQKIPFKGTEDCLYLNVYTPHNAKKGDHIPVIFFIQGGSFQTGYLSEYGPDYMMDRDVILVRANFRLGLLGMFSTGDSVVPGNMALKDQSMVLKWIKKNIYHFGGDPQEVTIQGHSSGATSCLLHTYSPLSRGLFKRVIAMSPVASWNAIRNQTKSRNLAREIAETAGCPKCKSSEAIFECISNKSTQELVNIVADTNIWEYKMAGYLVPVLEDPVSEDAFIPEMWWKPGFKQNDIPLLLGMTSAEWGEKVAEYLQGTAEAIKTIDQHHLTIFPIMANYFVNTKPNSLNFASQTLRTYYFGDEEITAQTDENLVQMLADLSVTFSLIDTVHRCNATKYVYLFDYKSNYSNQFAKTTYTKYLGPAHVDSLMMLYPTEESRYVFTTNDIAFSDETVKRHVNFAYTGDPNKPFPINESIFGHWSASISPEINYLTMNVNGSMKTGFRTNQFKFLSSLPLFNNLEDSY